MKKFVSVNLWFVAAILLLISCNGGVSSDTKREDEIVCVKTALLPEKISALPVEYPGILSSKQVVKLSFKTGGIVSAIYVNEGSVVKKGQIIAMLNMTEISSQAGQAKVALEKADRDLKRIKALYNDTVATLEQFQDATSAYEAAIENSNIAGFNLQYSKITAPADGRIIARLAEEHELVGPGTPVLMFCESGKEDWIVKAGLSDRDIVNVRKGDKAKVEFDAFPGRVFAAFVTQVAEMADPQSGTFEVEVTIRPENARLINGLIGRITIETDNRQQVTMVPPEAITQANGRRGFVYVINRTDSTAQKIPVTIAYFENDYIAIVESLNDMGAVVTEGASYLQEGSKLIVNNE